MTYYEEYPEKNIIKDYVVDGVKKTCTMNDILKYCGEDAYKLLRCRKDRYGFDVIYKIKSGEYDSRDSGEVSTFISYVYLT